MSTRLRRRIGDVSARVLANCSQLQAFCGTVVQVVGIGEFIREQREQAQVSVRQLARLAGVSNPYLSQIERGLRRPSADILQQLAKALRISAEQLYVRAGLLEDREGDPELIAAILADPGLTERQKNVLIEVYASFRRENAATDGVAP